MYRYVGSYSGGDVRVAAPSVVETWTCVTKGESGRGQGRREDKEDWSLTPGLASLNRAF